MSPRYSPEQVQERIKELLSFERQEELDPFRVMAFLPIEPYHHVADIGCGPGFFTIPMAKHLIHGKVYAVDISPEMLETLRQRVQDTFLGNVEIIQSEEYDVPLAPESVDGALLAFVLHEVDDRERFLRTITPLLRPGGWAGVVEWLPDAPSDHPTHNRIAPRELGEAARAAGLRLQEWRELSGKHYLAVLRRPRPRG